MSEQTSNKLQITAIDQRMQAQRVWQAWGMAAADCTVQLQYLQTFNFVFRTVWDPQTRAIWLLKLRTLREAVLHSQQIWLTWQAQVEAGYQAQFARQSKASGLALQQYLERLVAESRDVQTIWGCVLQELAYAEGADEYFLPDDARWLATRTYRHYKQILYATEQARFAAEAWVIDNAVKRPPQPSSALDGES